MIKFAFKPLDYELDTDVVSAGIFKAANNVATFFDARDIVAEDMLPVPPRRKYPEDYPLEWTKQEREEYFRKVRAGLTTFPYQRTGNLFGGFRIDASKAQDGAIMTISNNVDYVIDVVGSFASKAGQKKYHNITGWVPLVDTLPVFLDRLETSVQEELQRTLDTDIIKL